MPAALTVDFSCQLSTLDFFSPAPLVYWFDEKSLLRVNSSRT